MKKMTKKKKTSRRTIWNTPVPPALEKLMREIQEVRQLKESDFFSLPAEGLHPWKPEDDVIMDGQRQPDLVKTVALGEIQGRTVSNDSVENTTSSAPTTGYKHIIRPVNVCEAKKAMKDAGEIPGFIPYSVWKERQRLDGLLYAVSKLSFWQKLSILFTPKRFVSKSIKSFI